MKTTRELRKMRPYARRMAAELRQAHATLNRLDELVDHINTLETDELAAVQYSERLYNLLATNQAENLRRKKIITVLAEALNETITGLPEGHPAVDQCNRALKTIAGLLPPEQIAGH